MHDLESMPARLEAFLASVDATRQATVESYALMTGGYSRVMAKEEVRWSDGTTQTLVLRGDPPPEKTMLVTDRDAEWAVLKSLSGVAAVPMQLRFTTTSRAPTSAPRRSCSSSAPARRSSRS